MRSYARTPIAIALGLGPALAPAPALAAPVPATTPPAAPASVVADLTQPSRWSNGYPGGITLRDGFPSTVNRQPLDYTAPTRPSPLEIELSNAVTLHWTPSTDDHGPVTYEVYESGRLLTKTSDNRHVYATSPFLPPRIYVFAVRAVDTAGNVSASAYRSLGQIWRGDETPEPPSGLRVEPAAPGLLRLTWTEAPSGSIFTVPPVAGYEVLLDGEPIGQVGSASIVVSRPAPGPHIFAVRTLNAVDRYSPPVELAYVS